MKKTSASSQVRRAIVESLEKRLLLSADIPGLLGAEGLTGDSSDDVAQRMLLETEQSAEQASAGARELVVVDPGVEGSEELVADLQTSSAQGRDFEAVLLDSERDGIDQLREVLSRYDDIDAVHVISHGASGSIALGATVLDGDTLRDRSSEIAAWGDHLSLDADLLIYGCDVASDDAGKRLVQGLAGATGADVAASIDLTGAVARGGDWDLEYRSGNVATEVALDARAQAEFSEVLATFTVTTTADSGHGSLRNAIEDANDESDPSRIEFSLEAGSVISLDTELPSIHAEDLVIDASVDGAPGVVLDGGELDGDGLEVHADGVEIRGLVIQNFDGTGIDVHGDNVTIAGNYIGTNVTGTAAEENSRSGIRLRGDDITVGGMDDADRNVISGNGSSGIFVKNSDGHTILNNFIGVDASGSNAIGNGYDGILLVNSDDISIGVPGFGNVISGNHSDGIDIVDGSEDNVIRSNKIGVDAQGMTAIGNGDDGISMFDSCDENVIGGSGANDGNLISGNAGDGIKIVDAEETVIQGNSIGVDALGSSVLGNAGAGITLDHTDHSLVGGVNVGEGNRIAGNQASGIFVDEASKTNAFLGNAIFANAELGIDLSGGTENAAGVTENDSMDPDGGSNRLQNFPVINYAATVADESVTISGDLNSRPHGSFRLEFFENSGLETNGEGESYIGFTEVTTDAFGNASFQATLSALDPSSNYFSATATRISDGIPAETSEFAVSVATFGRAAVSLPGNQITREDTALVFSDSDGNPISVGDGSALDLSLRVSLAVDNGSIHLSTLDGLSVAQGEDGSSEMTIIGLESAINAALDGAEFSPDKDYNGSADLRVIVENIADAVGQYTFSDPVTPGADSSDSGSRDAVLEGATRTWDAERGHVIELDGDDYLSIGGDFSAPSNVTVTAWVNMNGGAGSGDVISIADAVVVRVNDAGTGGLTAFFNNGADWEYVTSDVELAGTGWHHLAYAYDDVEQIHSLYVDGEKVDSASTGGPIDYQAVMPSDSSTSEDVESSIGRSASESSYYFEGRIGEVRVYDRSLSGGEIEVIANDGSVASDAVTVGVGASPDVAAPERVVLLRDGQQEFSSAEGNALEVVYSPRDYVRVTLEVSHGTLDLAQVDGVEFARGNGISDESMIFTGKVQDVNAALDGLVYTPVAGYLGEDPLVFHAVDAGNNEGPYVRYTFDDGHHIGEDTGVMGDYPGTSTGVSTRADAERGRVAHFDGLGDYIEIGDPDPLNSGAEISFAAWINPDPADVVGNIIAKGSETGNGGQIFMRVKNGEFQVGTYDGSTQTASVAMEPGDTNSWVHLVGTYDGDAWNLYKNGELVASTPSPAGIIEVDDDWMLGADSKGDRHYFDGLMDDAMIFANSLTPEEVLRLYTGDSTSVEIIVNAAPTTVGIDDVSVLEDAPNTVIDLFAAFDDIEDADEDLTYTVTSNSNPDLFDSVSVDGSAGTLTLDYALNAFGSADLEVRATDTLGFSVSTEFSVSVAAVNDAPTLGVVSLNPTFVEGADAETLYQGTVIDLVETTDRVEAMVLTVAGVQNGSDEVLWVDGEEVSLLDATSLETGANGFQVSIGVSGGTATVTLSQNGGTSTADAGALIDGLQYQNKSEDPLGVNRVVTLTSIRDDGGTANGGVDTTALSAVSTVSLIAVNDAPQLSSNASNPTFVENEAAVSMYSGTLINLTEAADQVKSITLTVSGLQNGSDELLSVDGTAVALIDGASATTAANGFKVSVGVSGGTATVLLSQEAGSSVADAQALVDGLEYKNTSEDPLGVDRIITLTSIMDDGGTANGGVDTTALFVASTISITAVNDAPVASATATDPTFTENGSAVAVYSGANINLTEAADRVKSMTLTVSGLQNGSNELLWVDGASVVLTEGTSVTTGANSFEVSVSVSGGTATVMVNQAAGSSVAGAQALITGLEYENTSEDPLGVDRIVTWTSIMDDGGTANGGVDTTALSFASTVSVTAVNDAPKADATALDPAFVENGEAVSLYSGASIDLTEAADRVESMTLTVSGLQNGSDELLSVDGAGVALTDGNSVTTGANGFEVSVSVSGGAATVTVSQAAGSSVVDAQALIDGLQYKNASEDPLGADRVVTWTSIMDDGGTANGGVDATALSVASTVVVIGVNDAPEVNATPMDPTFVENGAAVYVYSAAGIDLTEAADRVQSITLTVSGLQNGSDESLSIDDTAVALTDGNSASTDFNGFEVTVNAAGGTATLTISQMAGSSVADIEALIDGLQYKNASEDPLGADRIVTLTSIVDDGGTANGGVDTTALSIASQISITAVNDAPVANSVATNPTFVENGSAVSLYSDTHVDLVEASDRVQSMTLTVSGLQNGADETLSVDGTAVELTDGSSVVTAANGFDVEVNVMGGTATLMLSQAVGSSVTDAQALIDGLQYKNGSEDVLGATRVMTLTSIMDNGGTANGGVDTTALSIVSTVSMVAVNDAPAIAATGTNPSFIEGKNAVALYAGASIDFTEAADRLVELTLTVSGLQDGADEKLIVEGESVSLVNGTSLTTAVNAVEVNVSVSGGTAMLTLSSGSGLSTAQAESLVDSLAYENTSEDPQGLSRFAVITSIQDSGGTANGGADTTAVAIASMVALTPVNDAPEMSVTALDPTFVEGGSAESIFSDTSINTTEAGDQVSALSLTVSGLQNGSDEIFNVDGTDVPLINGFGAVTGDHSYSVVVSTAGGTATLTITQAGGIDVPDAQVLVDGLTYRNTSDDPLGAERLVTIASIQDDGGTANDGVDTTALSLTSTISMVPVNDAPALSANASNPTFTENGAPEGLYTGTAIDLTEAADQVASLTLTVSGLQNGTDELLIVDGESVVLVDGTAQTTASNGFDVKVAISGATATVSVSQVGGTSVSDAQDLVDGLEYQNTSDDPHGGTRTVILASIQDTGGTSDGGVDTTGLAIISTVSLVPINDAPSLAADPSNPTWLENGPAVGLFDNTAIDVVEASDDVSGITFTVAGLQNGSHEKIVVDGQAIELMDGVGELTANKKFSVVVQVSGGTATVTVTQPGGIDVGDAQALVDGLEYQNSSEDPLGSDRVVTLSNIEDTGGTENGGVNSSAVGITSTVTLTPVNDAPKL
ncbi:DUF4347 domain-containing protein, partial [Myxococcota bacterium]|nr:DUF4347 domain-containing protein [Myxococcota bacterium]